VAGWASAFSGIFTALAIMRGAIPPTLNFSQANDGAENQDFVPDLGRRANLQRVLYNAFGFGGVNAAWVRAKP
jgi:3-oxoacyl-[acyl-carrier-protein] synthase II